MGRAVDLSTGKVSRVAARKQPVALPTRKRRHVEKATEKVQAVCAEGEEEEPMHTTATLVTAVKAKQKVSGCINQGDTLTDVIRFWCYVCRKPDFLFWGTNEWDTKPYLDVNSGTTTIYGKFVYFVDLEAQNESARTTSIQDEGVELRNVDGVSFGSDSEEHYAKADVFVTRSSATEPVAAQMTPMSTSHVSTFGGGEDDKEEKVCPAVGLRQIQVECKTSQAVFWQYSKVLIEGIKMSASKVRLPNRFAMTTSLRRLGQKVYMSTGSLQTQVSHVVEAYSEERYHRLHWLLTPQTQRGADRDSHCIAFYDLSSATLSALSIVQYAYVKHAAQMHPIFTKPAWVELLFLTVILAKQKDLYIHFKFQTGLHYQYLTVYEQSFEVLDEIEAPDVNNSHNGARSTFMKNVVHEDDYQNGRSPQWQYEFDVPSPPDSDVNEFLPQFHGLKVRFIFREDHSAWFFK